MKVATWVLFVLTAALHALNYAWYFDASMLLLSMAERVSRLKMQMTKKRKITICVIVACLLAASAFFAPRYLPKAVARIQRELIRQEIISLVAGNEDMQRFYVPTGYTDPNAYIAHGGGVKEFVYHNSPAAVKDSLSKGFKFIEIDMLVTSDGQIVGGHDWVNFKKLNGIPELTYEPLESKQVEELKLKQPDRILLGRDIVRIMEENPDLVIVTDKIDDYDLLLREIPYPDRLIVEVEGFELYLKALRSGVKYPALDVVHPLQVPFVEDYQIPIICMQASAFFSNPETVRIVKRLHDRNVTILMFGGGENCKAPDFLQRHLGKTVSKCYSDTYSPNELP